MILTDLLTSEHTPGWDIASACGVKTATVRLPETEDFDLTDAGHWQTLCDRFMSAGLKPIIIEPMPNRLHDHIKAGDSKRDESIEKVIRMLPIMGKMDVRMICFNFMAFVGWTRTRSDYPERGGAKVTGFRLNDYIPRSDVAITADQLWENYFYFLRAILPEAEKYSIRLALHPDDPPLTHLGNVERIMISYENIKKAIQWMPSDMLGVTFCQASYLMMKADLEEAVKELADKIFFVHFRNVTGCKTDFRETFHDNGDIDMARMIRLYEQYCPSVPVRVDHVPTLIGERADIPGYAEQARLFAIGYLKGLIEQTNVLEKKICLR